jgi:POT family proton-dependent oligopeptide transporter
MQAQRLSQGLASLCLSIGLERAAYFGLQSILALYLLDLVTAAGTGSSTVWLLSGLAQLTGAKGLALASIITGLFLSLTALAPMLGGVIADRVIGHRHAILSGGALMVAGHGLMIVDEAVLLALIAIALGSGLFKGTAAAQLSTLYGREDAARVEGFRLFYIAINLAGLIAPMVIGTLGQRVAWHAGFAGACLLMIAGLALYWRRCPMDPAMAGEPMADPAERPRNALPRTIGLLAIGIALICVTNFQITNAYLLWVDRSFDLSLGSWQLPSSWMMAADGLLSLFALAGSSLFWPWYERRAGPVGAETKALIGCVCVMGGGACLVSAAVLNAATGIPMIWGLGFQLLNSLGLANVLPAVMAMFGQASDRRNAATVMSGFYLALFAGGLLSTALAAQFALMPVAQFWALHLAAAGLGSACFAILWLRRPHHREHMVVA